MRSNAKNYQLWNHRRKCALRRGAACARAELDFVARALAADDKNYHAWAHRLAIVAAFGAWDGEAGFADACLSRDVRNNSAWQHRGAALRARLHGGTGGGGGGEGGGGGVSGDAAARRELEDAIGAELVYTAAQ
eukprot:364267-Chlamydomonas_euryale.AAC.11